MNYQQIKIQFPNLDVIPVRKNTKLPLRKNWQRIPPEKQWEGLDGDFNIGVRPSNGLIIFDADDKETENKVEEMFPDATIGQTQSGGRHLYIFVDDITKIKTRYNKQYKVMQAFKGEIRFGEGSQTLLPPSKVKREDGSFGHYKLLKGDFKTIPTYDFEYVIECIDTLIGKAVKKLAVREGVSRSKSFDNLIVPLHKRNLYDHIEAKLEWLSTAQAKDSYTDGTCSWDTRNELEFEVVVQLILSGWDIYEIQDIFDEYQSGHYIESANPDKYIEKLYASAMNKVTSYQLVDEIQCAWNKADTSEIYSKKRVIILALLSTALQFRSREIRLSKLSISGITSMMGNESVSKFLDDVIEEYGIKVSYNEDGRILYDITEMIEFFLKKYDAEKLRLPNLNKDNHIFSASDLDEHLTTIYRMGDVRLKILETLQNGDKTVRELTEKAGVTRQTVDYHVKLLLNKDLIEKVGNKIRRTIKEVVETLDIKGLIVYVGEKIAERLEKWEIYKANHGLTELSIRNIAMYHIANNVNKHKKTVLA